MSDQKILRTPRYQNMLVGPLGTLSVLQTNFFGCKVEVCCEHAITFNISHMEGHKWSLLETSSYASLCNKAVDFADCSFSVKLSFSFSRSFLVGRGKVVPLHWRLTDILWISAL